MSKNILIIGGTRNMGYKLARALYDSGATVTVLNRGISKDNLPEDVHRLRADRTDPQQMKRALLARKFDAVVDFVLYTRREAETAAEILKDVTNHYIFMSSGQVYLVREGISRPFKEADYEGRLLPPPKANTHAANEYDYGINKRGAEDALQQAHTAHGFPYTVLRLPMVNSEYDPLKRLYSYYLRLKDGGPILIPETPNYPLRHIYSGDVVRAIMHLIETGQGIGKAYNISQDETVDIDEFMGIMGEIMDVTPRLVRFKRSLLEANGFLPDASPFSERWMSELDNTLSKTELGMTYTPLRDYLAKIIAHFDEHKISPPLGYKRRHVEIQMVERENEQG